jgi:molecular chaperone DnaJ
MSTQRDYYEVLSVERNASGDTIARSYRKMAIKYHPDSNRDDTNAISKFKEAAEAYEVLSDPEKRSRYDQYGHAGVNAQQGGFQDVGDIFEAFSDVFGGSVFGDMFGRGGGGRRRVRKGADLRCDVVLDLEEAATGVEKTVPLTRHVECKTCDGSGAAAGSKPQTCTKCGGRGQVVQATGILRVQTACPVCQGTGETISNPCKTCDGHGLQPEEVDLNIAIPAGVDDGMRIRLTGQGQPSPDGGPPGDAYCFVSLRRHSIFQRDGQNLILQMPITYAQATLGTTREIPTLDGKRDLEIKPGTQSGMVYRIRGLGMPQPHSAARGDLLVQTSIEVPKKISKRAKELLRELAEIEEEHVSPERESFLARVVSYFSGEADDPKPSESSKESSLND